MGGWRLLAAAWALLIAVLAGGALLALVGEETERSRALVSLTPIGDVISSESPPELDQPEDAETREAAFEAEEEEPDTPLLPGIANAPLASAGLEAVGAQETVETDEEQTADTGTSVHERTEQDEAEQVAALATDPGSVPVRVERRGTELGLAWLRNATPFSPTESSPLVGVVVTRLGLGAQQTQDAILTLPPEVSLSFTPYARGLEAWIDKARQFGHEVLLDLPMEGEPGQGDPGHYVMSTQVSAAENLTRLSAILERSDRIMGLTRALGDVFVRDGGALQTVLRAIKQAGLAYLDVSGHKGASAGGLAQALELPHAEAVSMARQGLATRLAVDSVLSRAEAEALETGGAVVVIEPSPVAYQRLMLWAGGLSARGVALAPLSELILRSEDRYLAENQ